MVYPIHPMLPCVLCPAGQHRPVVLQGQNGENSWIRHTSGAPQDWFKRNLKDVDIVDATVAVLAFAELPRPRQK